MGKTKKNYYVYAIINKTNGMKYIGKRGCNCNISEDKYFGSGNKLKEAIKLEGKHNFKKVILKEFTNEDEMNAFEVDLIKRVGALTFNRDKYYNESGSGGKRKVILLNNGKVFNSIMDASRETGLNHSDIYRNCKGMIKSDNDWYIERFRLQNGEVARFKYLNGD